MNKGVTLFRELDSAIALLVEETDLSYDSLDPDIGCLVHLLDKIPDFRDEKLVSYRLSNLLLISLVLIMKREFRSFRYAASYIKVYEKDFARMGLIEEGKVPSHDTLRRMFMLLDAQEVKKALINNMDTFLAKIMKNWSSEEKELISVDGKEFRGSGRSANAASQKRNKNVLNVYNTSKEICIYSNPLDDKESEIKEAQEILARLNLKNAVVTGDALHCQKKTCQTIRDRKGNYVFTVKENQQSLLEEMKARMEKGKGAQTLFFNDCEYAVLPLPSSYAGLEFPGQKTYVRMVSSKRKRQASCRQTERYFLSSLKDPRIIAEAIDNRWKIENDLHKTKDEIFSEDGYRFSDRNAVKVMAGLNNVAYSFFRITAAFLKEETPTITKIKFQKDPIEVLSKISPLLNSRRFNSLIEENMKGKR